MCGRARCRGGEPSKRSNNFRKKEKKKKDKFSLVFNREKEVISSILVV
jgi:hypothetical protein